MRAMVVALLLLVFLSGCSSSPKGSATGDSSSSTSGVSDPSMEAPVEEAPLPAVEVFNDTLTFASTGGGSAETGTFEIPAGYGNVTVMVTTSAQCPGYSKAGAVGVTAMGVDESVPLPFTGFLEGMPVSDAGGYAPYTCAPNDYAQDRTSAGTVTLAWPVQPGPGTLAAEGEFTGSALVVVTAFE